MKNIITYKAILILILSLSFASAKSQNESLGEVQVKEVQSFKNNEEIIIQFKIDLSSTHLPSQAIINITPVIQSTDLSKEYRFNPIIVTGKVRNKAYLRRPDLYHSKDQEPSAYFVRKKGEKQIYPILLTHPYEEWMHDAKFIFQEEISGCAQCDLGKKETTILAHLLPPIHKPSYEIQYVMPEAEPVKHRSETYTAHLNFKVGKSELLRDFGNNAHILSQVDQIVGEIRGNDDLTIQSMNITGYASPEGNYNNNLELSKNRSFSFVNYLTRYHQFTESMMKTNWHGEDWEGLRKNIMNSSLSDRDVVIRVIDENQDISQRKVKLKALNGGETYRTLLNDYYPSLRRIEYTFSYVARAFDIEEAREIVKTKPHYLSLNEMFLVANTYTKGSKEFNQIFDIAVRLYPDDPVANINAAAQEIEMGALDKAIERLLQINTLEALNNLGVAYTQKGDYTQAANCFSKSAEGGNSVASFNKQELEKFLGSR